jgi:inner membrane protein
LWLLTPLPPEILQANMGILAAAAAFSALLPDLDASESKIKHFKIPNTHIKPFLLPALVVSRSDQHRGLLHSLAGLGMMTIFFVPAVWWTGWAPVVALLLGYASHILADAATKSGVRLLYPNPRRFHLLPPPWRFTTGSMAEDVLTAPLSVIVILLLLTQLTA